MVSRPLTAIIISELLALVGIQPPSLQKGPTFPVRAKLGGAAQTPPLSQAEDIRMRGAHRRSADLNPVVRPGYTFWPKARPGPPAGVQRRLWPLGGARLWFGQKNEATLGAMAPAVDLNPQIRWKEASFCPQGQT